MNSLRNSVQLIGNLGKDPEVKVYEKSRKASFSIATTDQYKNAKGETVKDTQWHNVVIWGKLADVAGKYYVPKLGAFIVYTLMIVILMVRPQGLFARAGKSI